MTSWNPQANDIFLKVLELAGAEERRKYLDDACAGQPALRAEVEALLDASTRAGSFLDLPTRNPVVTVDQPLLTDGAGTVIGPYKLLEKIGEGGFGVVFMAEQSAPIRRKVALKILKPGMDTRQIVARFEAERQALAIMDHPNVAKILDGGSTDSGKPYFVMELVKGVSITEFCDQNHLTLRQRLELFAVVCQAVQHAHQKGIIHRDLKPSNVLVTAHDTAPVVKVIDFGIAKALGQELTDKTLFTGFAQMIGTPLYMSPEQAGQSGLDIDTRSDIYSLGVLLYELLTGTTPFSRDRFKQAAYDEIRRIIREEDPPKPSTRLFESKDSLPSVSAQRQMEPAKLTRSVRGDLDWIVMKALEKDRNRRYETANGFALDVQRYLADEPVLACPPSVGYRLRKFLRRNKTAVRMGVVIALALLLVVGSVGWMARDRAAQREEEARKEAARQLVVEQGLDRSIELLKEGKWQESLVEARRAEAALDSDSPDENGKENVAKRLKDLRMVGDLEELRNGDHDADSKKDITYSTLFRNYGIDVDELPVDEAAALIRDSVIRDYLIGALDYWGMQALSHWIQRGKEVAEATRKRDHLHAIVRAADRDEFRARIRAVQNDQEGLKLLMQADSAYIARLSPASVLLLSGVLPRDERHMFLRQAQARHPDSLEITSELASDLSHDPKTLADSIRYYQAAVALRPKSLGLLANLAAVLERAGRKDEILFFHQRAAELHPQNAHAQYNLAVSLIHARRWPEAVDALNEALRLKKDWAPAYYNLALAYERQKMVAPAIAALQEYVRLDPDNFVGHVDLAVALELDGQRDKSLASAKLAAKLDPPNAYQSNRLAWWLATHPEPKRCDPKWAVKLAENATRLAAASGDFWNTLALAYYRDKRYKDADAALTKAMSLRKGGDPFDWFLRSMLRQQSGKTKEAESWYERAVQWMETNAPKVDADLRRLHEEAEEMLTSLKELVLVARKAVELDSKNADAHFKLGLALDRQGHYAEAIAAYRQAVTLNPKMAGAFYNLGRLLRFKGAIAEAIDANRQAILAKPDHAGARQSLAGLLFMQGDELEKKQVWPQAIAAYREALTLKTVNDPGVQFRLAHVLATCPDRKYRDGAEAVKFAEQVVAVEPDEGVNWLTLGMARYRAGLWAAAIEAMNKARELCKDRVDGVAYFVLAVCHWQKGERMAARHWYDTGVRWVSAHQADLNQNPAPAQIVAEARAEAKELLGIDKKKP